MSDKKAVMRGFRAWPENQERLEFAEEKELNVSELINKVLSKHLKPMIESEMKRKREQLAAPVP